MRKNVIIERNFRSAITECYDESCGPDTAIAIDAEIEIEKNGETLFIAAQWIDTDENEITMRVTKESTFELNTKPYLSDKELDKLHGIFDEGLECNVSREYPNEFYQLISAVQEKMFELGWG